MTKKVLNKLPEKVLSSINIWKDRYHDERFNTETTRAEIRGYLKGLMDTDVLSQNEFRLMFAYMTV